VQKIVLDAYILCKPMFPSFQQKLEFDKNGVTYGEFGEGPV
jgi:hypothetical protein